MGTSWYSEGELVSREPEVIKSLIEEIVENEDVTTRICDLEIRGNSVFFNSKGYGCYGTDFEDENSAQLFEQLFERYDKALIAFEHVSILVSPKNTTSMPYGLNQREKLIGRMKQHTKSFDGWLVKKPL